MTERPSDRAYGLVILDYIERGYFTTAMVERLTEKAREIDAHTPYADCCDTPHYCSSVRRCTAKDAAAPEGAQRAGLLGYVSAHAVEFVRSEDAYAKRWIINPKPGELVNIPIYTTPPQPQDAVQLARRFHDEYERLAPSFGYETRTDTRQFDPESPNGRLMIAVCAAIAGTQDAARED